MKTGVLTDRNIEVMAGRLATALDNKQPMIVFLDREGLLVQNSFAATDRESDTLRLIESVEGNQVCTAIEGELMSWDGDVITLEDFSRVVRERENELSEIDEATTGTSVAYEKLMALLNEEDMTVEDFDGDILSELHEHGTDFADVLRIVLAKWDYMSAVGHEATLRDEQAEAMAAAAGK